MNRKDAMVTQGINRSYREFLSQSFLYFVGILCKIFLAKFIKNPNTSYYILRLSWTNTFYKRLKELPGEYPLLHYNYKKFSKIQILFFKNVSLFNVFYEFLCIKKNNTQTTFEQDNLFYRLVIAAESLMFQTLFKSQPCLQRIFIAGINDRQTVMLSEICFRYNIKLSVLQHGCFTKFLKQYKVISDEFYYFYDFSVKYLKYFMSNPEGVKIKYLPRKQNLADLPLFGNKINIAYATTPIKSSINFEIIDLLIKNLDNRVTLIINPHPVDDASDYIKRYGSKSNIEITGQKYKNIKYFFLRYSTLGIEMGQLGIKPIFINIENYQTDFFEFGNVTVFNDLSKFEKWLYYNSDIREYYKLSTTRS